MDVDGDLFPNVDPDIRCELDISLTDRLDRLTSTFLPEQTGLL
jgi:hypothetical protein